jgi:hypothetical protein
MVDLLLVVLICVLSVAFINCFAVVMVVFVAEILFYSPIKFVAVIDFLPLISAALGSPYFIELMPDGAYYVRYLGRGLSHQDLIPPN